MDKRKKREKEKEIEGMKLFRMDIFLALCYT